MEVRNVRTRLHAVRTVRHDLVAGGTSVPPLHLGETERNRGVRRPPHERRRHRSSGVANGESAAGVRSVRRRRESARNSTSGGDRIARPTAHDGASREWACRRRWRGRSRIGLRVGVAYAGRRADARHADARHAVRRDHLTRNQAVHNVVGSQ